MLTDIGQKSLKHKGLPLPTIIRGTIKGIFFQYWGAEDVFPKDGHVVDGIWMFADDFIEIYRVCELACRFIERKRPDWLSPLQAANVEDWIVDDILTPKMFSQMIYISILYGVKNYELWLYQTIGIRWSESHDQCSKSNTNLECS